MFRLFIPLNCCTLYAPPGAKNWLEYILYLVSCIHPQKSTKYNICDLTISLTHLLYVMSRSVWLIPLVSLSDPHIYVIYKSTEVHQIQYVCPYYITDTSSLCYVKVSLADSPGQSVWSPHLCRIYIHRSQSNICVPTISLTHLLYVMSRSVCMITMVSVVNTHMFMEIQKSRHNLYNKFVVTVCWHNGH